MNEKDVFRAKLTHPVIEFGHIKVWHRKAFQKFCLKHGFLVRVDGWRDNSVKVGYKFSYGYTYNNALHLPFAWIGVWISDFRNKKVCGSAHDNVLVESGKRANPNFDYVVLLPNGSLAL